MQLIVTNPLENAVQINVENCIPSAIYYVRLISHEQVFLPFFKKYFVAVEQLIVTRISGPITFANLPSTDSYLKMMASN